MSMINILINILMNFLIIISHLYPHYYYWNLYIDVENPPFVSRSVSERDTMAFPHLFVRLPRVNPIKS